MHKNLVLTLYSLALLHRWSKALFICAFNIITCLFDWLWCVLVVFNAILLLVVNHLKKVVICRLPDFFNNSISYIEREFIFPRLRNWAAILHQDTKNVSIPFSQLWYYWIMLSLSDLIFKWVVVPSAVMKCTCTVWKIGKISIGPTYKLRLCCKIISDVYRPFIPNTTTFTKYCLTQLPGALKSTE